jgi:RNA polymerase sigma-B factor
MTALATRTHASLATPHALFERSHRGDAAAREALVLQYMPLARRLARRYTNSSLPFEDLTQVANLALVQAIDRFEPAPDRAFEAFAIPTILGELRRFFRDTSWSVHVARGDQERSKAIRDSIDVLAREHGRPPTVQMLAQYLELSEEQVLDGLQVLQAYKASSLEAPASDAESEATIGSNIGAPDPGYDRVEADVIVEQALETLTPREQQLLELRFVDEMSQAQIGQRFGVSQMQISRLLKATLTKLRGQIGEIAEVAAE